MFAFFSRKKRSGLSGIRTISIADLAPLWRDCNEAIGQTLDAQSDDTQREGASGGIQSATQLENGEIESGPKQKEVLEDEDAAWFDEKRFFAEMKDKLEENRTSAFRYNGNAYYTLDTVARALNRQRRDKSLEPLQPQAVIDFFQTNRLLKSGKYVMRFDTGLPVKIYLYSHTYQASENSKSEPPVTENGRHLKSIKAMEKRET